MIDADIRTGDRIVVTFKGVAASGSFVAGIGQQQYVVRLDGTGRTVTVPGWTITREETA